MDSCRTFVRPLAVLGLVVLVAWGEVARAEVVGGLGLPLPEDMANESVALWAMQQGVWTGERGQEFALVRSFPLRQGKVQALRFVQTLQGLPVRGTFLSALVNQGHLELLAGKVIHLSPPSQTHSCSGDQAALAATRALEGEGLLGVDLRGKARKVYEIDRAHEGTAQPAFVVPARSLGPLAAWEVVVSGQTCSALQADRLDTRLNRGLAYLTNPIHGDPVEVDLYSLDGTGELVGTPADVYGCEGSFFIMCSKARTALADENGDFLYEPIEPSFDDPFAEVQAYYHAQKAHDFYLESFGFDVPPIQIFANFGLDTNFDDVLEPFDNAGMLPGFFGGNDTLLLGQGTDLDFGYDADVLYHEYGHSVVWQTAELRMTRVDELGLSIEPLALNEGSADFFSSSIAGDPYLAEYAASGFGMEWLRNLDNDHTCPGSMIGEGHEDGQIWAGALWEIGEALGQEVADELLFASLLVMGESSSFQEAAQVLLETSQTLLGAGQAGQVETILAGRGLLDCERIVPMEEGTVYLGMVYSATKMFVQGDVVPAPLQYVIDVTPEARSLSLSVECEWASNGEPCQAELYIRFDQPVTYLYDDTFHGQADGVYAYPEPIELALPEGPERPGRVYVSLLRIGGSLLDTLAYGLVYSATTEQADGGADGGGTDGGEGDDLSEPPREDGPADLAMDQGADSPVTMDLPGAEADGLAWADLGEADQALEDGPLEDTVADLAQDDQEAMAQDVPPEDQAAAMDVMEPASDQGAPDPDSSVEDGDRADGGEGDLKPHEAEDGGGCSCSLAP